MSGGALKMSIGIHDADKQFLARPTDGLFSLTTPQIPIWIDQSLHPQKPIYHIGQVLTLRTAVDIECFVAALERVVAENDALRLRFVQRDSDILQQVVSDVAVHLEFGDFSGERDPEAAAKAWIEQSVLEAPRTDRFPSFSICTCEGGHGSFPLASEVPSSDY